MLLSHSVRGQSALDGFDPNANAAIQVFVVQPDGKILIGGDFTTLAPNGGATVTRNKIARLNPNGTLDTAFNPNANGGVYAIALQADGKILVGGFFNGPNSIGGQPRTRMARLEPITGSADSFDPNANDAVLSIAVQTDGKILACGWFSSIGGQTRNRIARLDATTGAADSSFDPNANGFAVDSMAVQADGKILACGSFTSIGGQPRNNIARLDATTGAADSFNPNANSDVFAIAVQADGKILAGGDFNDLGSGANSIGGAMRNYIARLDATTGAADSSFNPNANSDVFAITVQADGKILAGGDFKGANSIGGQPRNRMARLDAATGAADSFDPNANSTVNALVVQADGKILTGGSFTAFAPSGGMAANRNSIARLELDGKVDQTLDLAIVGSRVEATAVQPDGKILIGGLFDHVLGTPRNNIARVNPDGTLDMAFNPNANGEFDTGEVDAIAVQADGKILVGGVFNGTNSIGGQPRNYIARLDATTGAADSFNPNANSYVFTIVVQADGKILTGGRFMSIGGEARNRIARLNPTGFADSFDPNANSQVFAIAVQADGKILAGGGFTALSPNGGATVTHNYIARLNPDGTLDTAFDPNANSTVASIAVQADGKILVGGSFNDLGSGANSIGGQPRNYIARLDPTTGMADSFDPNANNTVLSIAVQADGKILAGGPFNDLGSGAISIGGQSRNRIARLDGTTGLADSFNPNANNDVSSIAVQADGKILAGGKFSGANSIGGQPRGFFARLRNDTAALQNLAVTQSTITWTRGGSSPQFARVTFESSTDNVNYTLLGNGIPQSGSSNWTLTGLNLPTGQNIYIRARGYYRTGGLNGSESITESVRNAFLIAGPTPTPTPTPTPVAQLLNISTRLRVLTGDNVLIGGFIITGTDDKKVIIRGIGPSLTSQGVPDALQDPTLELLDGRRTTIAFNDNWVDSPDKQAIIDSTIPPSNDLESAIVATLPANNSAYTAILRGKDNTTGIGLVEVYDLAQSANSKLANISTRGFVDTGDNALFGGLIIGGDGDRKVILRAIGPSLTPLGVANALQDPTLELHNSNGDVIAFNDNWKDSQQGEIEATTIPPTNDLESAIVRTLPPGNYTAIVRGVNDTTGVALVEVYGLQ